MKNDAVKASVLALKASIQEFIEQLSKNDMGLTEALLIIKTIEEARKEHTPGEPLPETTPIGRAMSAMCDVRDQSRCLFFIMVLRIITIELDDYLKDKSIASTDSWK